VPEVRGDELARRIRDRRPGIPIVILTDQYDTGTLDADWSVLAKPIGLSELDQAIQRALRSRSRA
jgi:DNA-binding response OmpR family regulator